VCVCVAHVQVESEAFFCALCEVSVNASAKHCRACDKCVEGFDHHCKWLNNCVATRNYRSFFWLVAATSALVAVHLGVCTALFVSCFTDKDGTREQLRQQLVQDGLFKFKVDWSTFLGVRTFVRRGTLLELRREESGRLAVRKAWFSIEPRDGPNGAQASPPGGLPSAFNRGSPIQPSVETLSRVHTRTSGARGSKSGRGTQKIWVRKLERSVFGLTSGPPIATQAMRLRLSSPINTQLNLREPTSHS